MYPVSDKFLASLRGPHTVRVKVQILLGGEVVVDDVPILSGSVTQRRVTADKLAGRQRTGQITLADPIRLPVDARSVLAPFGAEVRVWSGLRWWDGTEELVPLITGPIQDSDGDLGSLVTSLSFEDRSRKVADALFESTYQVASGSDPAEAWRELILSRVDVPISSVSTGGFVTPLLTYPARDDPWEAAQSIAASVGCIGEFDGLGNCVMRSVAAPVVSGTPWPVEDGDEGILIGGSVSMSRRDSANRVIGTGGNTSTSSVWTSVATDDDPASPSYYHGDFGPKPFFVDFPAAGSQTATDAATAAELNNRRGVSRRVTLRSIPNPALLLDDPVHAKRLRVGLDEVDAIDQIVTDLGHAGVQTIDTRTVQAA